MSFVFQDSDLFGILAFLEAAVCMLVCMLSHVRDFTVHRKRICIFLHGQESLKNLPSGTNIRNLSHHASIVLR